MAPYRTPSLPVVGTERADGASFAFWHLRMRIGVDRFEVSFWDPLPFYFTCLIGPMCAPLCVPFVGGRVTAGLLGLTLFVTAMQRVHFVVTRRTSQVVHRVLGLRWHTELTGRLPEVSQGGWDWDELAIRPSLPALRAPLHDGSRAVLAEWNDGNLSKSREADLLAEMIRAQIARLHPD